MSPRTRSILIVLFAATLVGAPCAYSLLQDARYRNLRVVRPGVLYRSGQLDPAGLQQVVYDFGIRTIITLREENQSDVEAIRWEEAFCRRNDLALARIPPRRWWSKTGPPPAQGAVEEFLAVVRDPVRYPPPILVHCFAGMHRTGAFCAIYRIEIEHWTAAQALEEMRACGYATLDHDWDVRDFIREYEPSWRRPQASRIED